MMDGWPPEDDRSFIFSGHAHNHLRYHANQVHDYVDASSSHDGVRSGDNSGGQETRQVRERVAFRTKSEVEILHDGFKWKKYGKKTVKNSPNPRNYYRCSVNGCSVKKRVERDGDDPSFVITTYDGIHNHPSPN
ncbi:hypothetical protein Nepgr_014227 [Nepenthes gracilis]|uniref:WRKY domain-containing protein n=1 Tax=Nepenthes gracilis TaxID=150966 RepID=A0AAD3SLA4_NEPGR|nr:hypothetical protein Nepgr_014227 [Nepenthes gracilis]